ncbi:MAG: DUF4349 domain-containing protein [Sphingomonas sp.]|uniref:DUF4349 domain-containing protein n=1 Tax=Sphingomonas sp. TaxID=28214 RepID=UPI0025D5228F|nr:DUF4349 domain-containing protein [Sphingomonas sp.]MBY0284338.1 DUF4349 domain-containing protein [Sphingomonas sp.]
MRGKAVVIVALMLAGCAKSDGGRDAPAGDAMTTESAASGSLDARGPGISLTAAPGVAFRYAYDFRIPAARISSTQEAHAQACEALGIARCRITGMHYAIGRGARDITASLDFKLDPGIARKFGATGIDTVVKAGGKLGSVDITGTDAGGAIKAIDQESARQRADLDRIEAQLAKLPPKARERVTLQEQADAIRQSLNANAANKGAQQASLATTPMHFDYGTTDSFAGFDADSPIAVGLSLGQQSFLAAMSLLTIVLAGGLPWALLALAGWWIWRRVRKRFVPE